MGIKSFIAKIWAKYRVKQINKIVANPKENQQKLLLELIQKAKNTQFAKANKFEAIKTYQDFKNNVIINDYEGIKPYIDEILQGKKDVLWPGLPLYLAKTSGTTSGSKYIPITSDSIKKQISGARDAFFCYINETQKASFLDGNMLFLSGSPILDTNDKKLKIGRLSGIVNHFVPSYLRSNQVPTYETNCIDDWELKVKKIVEEIKNKDLRLISGIPPWMLMLFEELKKQTGKLPLDNWKNLEVYVHGGVDFRPYRPIFEQSLGKKIDIVEVYPASEGFIAIQNSQKEDDLLLMLDYGIFYEFIEVNDYVSGNYNRKPLWEVELGKNYAIILTTNAGLWAYDLGDTVTFTSIKPYKIKVSGRVKHFISAFGEHVIQDEVNKAIEKAIFECPCVISDFTVAPFVSDSESYHEWLIEFEKEPSDLNVFKNKIDLAMQDLNIYYKDLRKGNILNELKISVLKPNACRNYMKSVGKLGGQNKFPRLSNNRILAEGLLMV